MGQSIRNIFVVISIVAVCFAIGAGLVFYAGVSIIEAVIGVTALFAVFVSIYNNQVQFGQFSKMNRQLREIHNFERRISGRIRDLEVARAQRPEDKGPEVAVTNALDAIKEASGFKPYEDSSIENPSILSELTQPTPSIGMVSNSDLDAMAFPASSHTDPTDNVIPMVRRSSIGDIEASISALVDSINLKPSQLTHALNNDDLELYLQPTLEIPSREVRYFEAFVHIKVEDKILTRAQFKQVAIDSRQMAKIDQKALALAFQIVRHLQRQDAGLAIFFNISPQTLRNIEIMDLIIEALEANKTIRDFLVCEISQSEFEKLNSTQRQNLARIRDVGFQLCLDDVREDEAIRRIVAHDLFSYLKIPAPELMRIGGADILNFADEIVPEARNRNITLIASAIENEDQVVAMIDADVYLAQGDGLVPAKPLKKELDAGNM